MAEQPPLQYGTTGDPVRERGRRGVVYGMIFFICGTFMVMSPLLLGSGAVMTVVVAFGFIAGCIGLSCILIGAWDLLSKKSK